MEIPNPFSVKLNQKVVSDYIAEYKSIDNGMTLATQARTIMINAIKDFSTGAISLDLLSAVLEQIAYSFNDTDKELVSLCLDGGDLSFNERLSPINSESLADFVGTLKELYSWYEKETNQG
jgi:hypothetical protein